MNKKSNMSAHIAVIASRTRMKQSATRIHSIFDAIPGHVLHCQVMLPHFTPRQLDLTKQTRAATAAKISYALEYRRHLLVALKSQLQRSRIGICG